MILVTGGTGLNGRELLRVLSANGTATRVLVRDPAKAAAIAALPHVEIVQGDMARPDTLAAALHGIERAMLISSSDPEMLDVQSNFIVAAKNARRDREAAGSFRVGVYPFARRRVHAGLFPAGS
jgi:uncharacterized protein YbjT (DUF2867 family)